jgi:uncharacterized protein (DUF952 family)
MSFRYLYKLCRRAEWLEATQTGIYRGSEADRRDGFIHLSTGEQVEETASRHFAGEEDLLLIAFDAHDLQDALRWEPSRGGALFPHHYGSLRTARAAWAVPLPWNGARHHFPLRLP